MRTAKIIGHVTLNACLDSVVGGRFLVARPLSRDGLSGAASDRDDVVVVYDELGATDEVRIAVSEGREAAMPFWPRRVPLDAYNAALLDEVSVAESKPPS